MEIKLSAEELHKRMCNSWNTSAIMRAAKDVRDPAMAFGVLNSDDHNWRRVCYFPECAGDTYLVFVTDMHILDDGAGGVSRAEFFIAVETGVHACMIWF